VSRDEHDHRRYGAETVAVLEALACLRSAGMSVGDMRHYLSLLGRGDEASAQQRDLFARHAERPPPLREAANRLGQVPVISSRQARDILGWAPRDAETTIVDTAVSLL
jgi:DNA-binding transcriptional MerR regulator